MPKHSNKEIEELIENLPVHVEPAYSPADFELERIRSAARIEIESYVAEKAMFDKRYNDGMAMGVIMTLVIVLVFTGFLLVQGM